MGVVLVPRPGKKYPGNSNTDVIVPQARSNLNAHKKNNDNNHERLLSNLSKKLHMPKIRNGGTENVTADGLGRVHTYRNIF